MSCREILLWFSTSLRLSSNFLWFFELSIKWIRKPFWDSRGRLAESEWINLVEFASEKWKQKEDLSDFGAREKKIDFGESWSSCEGQKND